MLTRPKPFIMPYEPEYMAHRTSSRDRRNTQLMVHMHMNALYESPSIAPETSPPEVEVGTAQR